MAIDAGAHDRLVALTSHLPHALANLVVNQAGAASIEGHDPLAAAGGSLRDVTRVAGANPQIWVDIFLDNRDELLAALADHRQGSRAARGSSRGARCGARSRRWIGEAAGNRRRVLRAAYAADPRRPLSRPGPRAGRAGRSCRRSRRRSAPSASTSRTSSSTTSRLSAAGVLGILVAGEAQAARAAGLLEGQGYGVIVSRLPLPRRLGA